jgi:hypothetical protein
MIRTPNVDSRDTGLESQTFRSGAPCEATNHDRTILVGCREVICSCTRVSDELKGSRGVSDKKLFEALGQWFLKFASSLSQKKNKSVPSSRSS